MSVPALPLPVVLPRACAEGGRAAAESRRWLGLALGSLILAGLLSLVVVLGRIPVLSEWIGDPLFFKRCLVVHVDLALVVWFYAFLCCLAARRAHLGAIAALARTLASAGILAMLAGALARGAAPVLSNYIPVVDHPVFLSGLATFFLGLALFLGHFLAQPAREDAGAEALPDESLAGLRAAAVAVLLAGATWISARAGLPAGLDGRTFHEFSFWGAGHVLQVANTAAQIAVWLWILRRATAAPVLTAGAARLLFGALLLPHLAMPLLSWRGTLDTLYHSGATALMRWGIFPALAAALLLGLRHLARHRGAAAADPAARALRTGFLASAGLSAMGMLLGACIRSSTTLVPAHYHACLGGVTAAFMTGAHLLTSPAGAAAAARHWTAARRQLALFGWGQAVFAAGFALGGLYGLGRKSYGSEQALRSSGELAGIAVMGAGGLVAAAAGVWFLVRMVRALRAPAADCAAPPALSPT